MNLDPDYYGLHKHTKLRALAENHIAIEKKISSRILVKDAQLVLKKVYSILDQNPTLNVSFICYPNICSKSLAFLKENNIDVIIEDKK